MLLPILLSPHQEIIATTWTRIIHVRKYIASHSCIHTLYKVTCIRNHFCATLYCMIHRINKPWKVTVKVMHPTFNFADYRNFMFHIPVTNHELTLKQFLFWLLSLYNFLWFSRFKFGYSRNKMHTPKKTQNHKKFIYIFHWTPIPLKTSLYHRKSTCTCNLNWSDLCGLRKSLVPQIVRWCLSLNSIELSCLWLSFVRCLWCSLWGYCAESNLWQRLPENKITYR